MNVSPAVPVVAAAAIYLSISTSATTRRIRNVRTNNRPFQTRSGLPVEHLVVVFVVAAAAF